MKFFVKKPKTTGFFAFALILIVFLFFKSGASLLIENIFTAVSMPFSKIFSATGYWFNDKILFISSISDLKKNNSLLLKENLELKGAIAEFKETDRENKYLREEMGLAQKEQYDLEAVFIIGKDLIESSEIVFIDKGAKHGIEKGMPVIIGKNVIIGKIDEVFYSQARVELILSQKNNIGAELENGEKGIVHGEYGTSAVIDMIAQTAQIKNQDSIITSGSSSKIPKGLLIGYVKESLPSSDQLFQKASINLPYEIEKVRMAWILKSAK